MEQSLSSTVLFLSSTSLSDRDAKNNPFLAMFAIRPMSITFGESIVNAPEDRKTAQSSQSQFGKDIVGHIPYLRAFARSLCRNRHDADELTQETMVRAWKARGSFQPDTNMRAWLLKILRNCFYSDLRRAKRQAPWNDAVAERVLVTSGAQTSNLALGELQRALAALPDEQREALILVGAGGIAYEEAAEICNCAVGTIKSRVSRARKFLVSTLNEPILAAGPRMPGADVMCDIEKSLAVLLKNGHGVVPRGSVELRA